MAFGGRELRLLLSIQSYGTTNISRLRRDILSLNAASRSANMNQMAVQGQMLKQAEKVAASQRKINQLEKQRLTATGLPALKAEQRLRRILNAEGLKGAALQNAIASGNAKSLSAQGRAALNSLRAQKAGLAQIDALLKAEVITLSEATAMQQRLTTSTYAQATALDKVLAKQNAMMMREARARTLQHAGRTAQFGGLIGTAIAATSAAQFATFNQQVVLAATQTRKFGQGADVVVKNADQLTNGVKTATGEVEGIIAMMQRFPATGDEMAQSAYDIFSSMQAENGGVLSVVEGLKLLEKFNGLAVATGTDLVTTTNAGITVLNNFGQSAAETDTALNLMVATVRFGRMHLDEFNAMLDKVAPAAAAAGMNLEDVSGAMALITTRQPSQRMSATGIARLLQTFRDPDFQKGAAKFGANITTAADGTGKLKPLPKIMEEMSKAFGLFEEQGGPQQLFKELTATGRGSGIGRQSRIEAANAYTFLMKNMKDYRLLQQLVTGDTDEFQKALEAMSDAPGVKWKVFINQMRAFVLVVGQAALPALLKIADVLVRAVQWFGQLNRETRETIVRWGVILSVGALLVGTLANIGGGILAMAANWKIMRLEAQLTAMSMDTVAKKTTMASFAMRGLAGIGMIAVPIAIQAMMGGDPGAWQLAMYALQGAAGGALLGSMFGPAGTAIGAVGGALTVPIVVSIMADIQGPKDPVEKAYDAYIKKLDDARDSAGGFLSAIDPRTLFKGVEGAMPFEQWVKAHPKLVKRLTKTTKDGTETQSELMRKYNNMLKRLNNQTAEEYASQVEKLEKAWRSQDTNLTEGQQRQQQIAEARANAVKQAMDNMNQKIETAVNNLAGIYDKFEQINKSAFSFFQGPTMQGMLGNLFSGLNDMLRQFGVQIPVPFAILRQDLDQQMAYFKRWRQGLNKLLARGASVEFVQEIQQMGPNAIPLIEGLLGASPKQFKKYVGDTKKIGTLVSKAAKQDMDKQLADWLKHGKNIAHQLVMGLSSTVAQAEMRAGFKTYVVNTFGSVLKQEMATEVAEAMKDAAAQIKAAKVTAPTLTPHQKDAAVRAAKDAAAFKKPINKLTMAETRRQIALGRQRIDKLQEGGVTKGETPRMRKEVARLNRLIAHQEELKKSGRKPPRGHVLSETAGEARSLTINEGDKVTIHADGANPHKVSQALNKRKFQKRNKRVGGV